MIKLIKRRYLALKVECKGPVDQRVVGDAVLDAVLRLFGEVGASQAALRFIHFDGKGSFAVLRCSHTALPMVKAAVASVTRIDTQPAAIHVLRVSGTLKALERKSTKT